MERGEIWTLRDDGYASKARPVVVVQNQEVTEFNSIILCLLTSFDSSGMPSRVRVEPTPQNGLEKPSYVMADKIVSVDRNLLGVRIGILSEHELKEIDAAIAYMLGLKLA